MTLAYFNDALKSGQDSTDYLVLTAVTASRDVVVTHNGTTFESQDRVETVAVPTGDYLFLNMKQVRSFQPDGECLVQKVQLIGDGRPYQLLDAGEYPAITYAPNVTGGGVADR